MDEKQKKTKISPINNDDNCFQNATIVASNHEEIGKSSQIISKLTARKVTGRDDWKKFDKE